MERVPQNNQAEHLSAGFIRIENKVHTTFDFLQKMIYLNSFLVCSCNLWKKKEEDIMRDIHKPGPAPHNSRQNKFLVGEKRQFNFHDNLYASSPD